MIRHETECSLAHNIRYLDRASNFTTVSIFTSDFLSNELDVVGVYFETEQVRAFSK